MKCFENLMFYIHRLFFGIPIFLLFRCTPKTNFLAHNQRLKYAYFYSLKDLIFGWEAMVEVLLKYFSHIFLSLLIILDDWKNLFASKKICLYFEFIAKSLLFNLSKIVLDYPYFFTNDYLFILIFNPVH